MKNRFPYAGLPDAAVWKRAVSDVPGAAVDPQTEPKFRVDRSTRIASAGSCFARRIATALSEAGYTYYLTEPGGPYSARYGDIYTTLQLAQLARRCIGAYVPEERPWSARGRWYDPLRARAHPEGFATVEELESERNRHLAAVRKLLEESEVFIFTLGLTEVWCSRAYGTAFPLCPGAGIGTFDDARYEFRNLTVDENVRYFDEFLEIAWSLNPALRVILTVSPVPLAATMEPHGVIQSTTYSKSVLRVAAELLRRKHALVEYFAAYEIVTSSATAQDYFDADRREVIDPGVSRVMDSFFRWFGEETVEAQAGEVLPAFELTTEMVAQSAASRTADDDACDEVYLGRYIASS